MANFLTLVQDLHRETEMAGTAPAAVTGQTGQLNRLVNWIRDAWKDIQRRNENWRWMRKAFSVNTVLGDDTYAFGDCTDTETAIAISRFRRWWANDPIDQFQCYLQSSGVGTEYRLLYLPWENFKYIYKIGTQNNGQPAHVTVDPSNNFVLGPKPDGVYVVSGYYQRGVQTLSANSDTPDMPTDFHDLIVYRAIEKYGMNSVAPECFQRGRYEGNRIMRALEQDQLPEPRTAEPMA